MTDLTFTLLVVVIATVVTVAFLGGLAALLARWDRQYLAETAFLLDQNSLRHVVRAEARLQRNLDRIDARSAATLERMDAHIAMVLERVDRDRQ